MIAELDTVSDRNPVSGDAAARDYHLEQAALHAWEGKSGAWGEFGEGQGWGEGDWEPWDTAAANGERGPLFLLPPRPGFVDSNSCFFFFFFLRFLGRHLQHKEVPRLGVKSEPQLPACPTAT